MSILPKGLLHIMITTCSLRLPDLSGMRCPVCHARYGIASFGLGFASVRTFADVVFKYHFLCMKVRKLGVQQVVVS